MSLKKKGSLMNLGGFVTLVDGAGYTEKEISLVTNSLQREVFVVTDVSVDYHPGLLFDAALGGTQEISGQVIKSSQSDLIGINDPSVLARTDSRSIQGGAGNLGAGAYVSNSTPDDASNGTNRDYIAIISTPNWFVGGVLATTTGGAPSRSINARITGYVAVATADVYAALVTEELNA